MTIVARVWLGALCAALATWVVAAATTRAQEEALNALRDYAFVQDAAQRDEVERAASTLIGDELARRRPDQKLIAAALAVLRQTPAAEGARTRVEAAARARLEAELAQRHPDHDALRGAYGLLALAGADDAREQLARIAALAGDRADAARALGAAAARLREAADRGAAADAALGVLIADRARLLAPAPSGGDELWAVRETPLVATALEDAAQAALIHFESLVATSREPGVPAAAAADPSALDPRLVARLRSAWAALQELGIADRCDAQTVARYAQATRRRALGAGAWTIVALLALALPGAALAALVRLRHGPSPIDPGAETIENESPIDLDTEAETLEAARSGRATGAGETTDH